MKKALGHLLPQQINQAEASRAMEQWRTALSPNTARNYRYALVSFLKRNIEGEITVPPIPKPDARTQTFTQPELQAMIQSSSAAMKLFTLLCLDCGMRFSTALSIRPEHWNAENRTLTFQTKGQRKMTLPASERLAKLLDAAAATAQPGTPLVEHLFGRKATKALVLSQWRIRMRQAGARKELHPHDLRRTMATAIYQQTKDLRAVQQFLGHRSLLSTVVYIAPHDPANLKQILSAATIPLSMRKKP